MTLSSDLAVNGAGKDTLQPEKERLEEQPRPRDLRVSASKVWRACRLDTYLREARNLQMALVSTGQNPRK